MATKKQDGKSKSGEKDEPYDPNAPALAGYIGVALLVSLVVGWGPLNDAVRGYGPLEDAMARFVMITVACLVAANLLGRLLDGAPPVRPGGGKSTTETGDDSSNESTNEDSESPDLTDDQRRAQGATT